MFEIERGLNEEKEKRRRVTLKRDIALQEEMTTMEKGLKMRSVYFWKGTQSQESEKGCVKRSDKVILNTTKEANSYLKEDKNNLRRITSHMLAYGKILFQKGKNLEKIQAIAKNNLKLRTKYKKSELLMHQYSIDDFWGEVQRDIKNKDYLAFGLDSQLLINNILELFLKLNGEFLRQPNRMTKILKRLDKKFLDGLKNFYKENDIQKKKMILTELVKYIYRKSGGPLPKKWVLKRLV